MAGYNRPEGGWNYVYNGINTVEAPDALQPDFYPYARNIRGLAERAVRTRPGYTLFSTSPSITASCPLATGQEDVSYSTTLTAVGGIAPYTWSIITGALPGGLTLHAATGIIDGTPTAGGLFEFTILVTDAAGGTDSVACSLYICPGGAGGDWVGCLGGSFSVPADWFTTGNISISGNQANISGVGGNGLARKNANGCGSSLNQEVYLIYNTKSNPFTGNRGYFLIGPGCRVTGSIVSNYSGYFFTAQIWGGTSGSTCGFGSGAIALNLYRVQAAVATSLAGISIAGPDLTPGIPFDIQVTVEGSGARVIGFLGGTQMMTALDPSPLPTGQMGMALISSCGGITPNINYSFIKGRNL